MNTSAYIRSGKVITSALKALSSLKDLDELFWSDLISFIEEGTGKLILTGVGKSGYIAMKVAATLTSLGRPATFVHPVEAMHGDSGLVMSEDVVIAFSFSGGTKELIQFVRHVKETCKVRVIGITKSKESLLGQLSERIIPIEIQEEGCPLDLAPMASTTAMLVIGDAIAAGLTSPELFTRHDFARLHPSGTLGLSLTPVRDRMIRDGQITVGGDAPLQMVLVRISELGKGIIGVVTDKGYLCGSITDGDIRRFLIGVENIQGTRASDVMSCNPKSITEDKTLKEALQLMESYSITNLFVVDSSDIPVGIVHMHDIINSHETRY